MNADPARSSHKSQTASFTLSALSRASVAAGADGLMIEVHPDPENALSDGAQSLTPAAFAELMASIRRLAVALDRQVATAPSPV